MVLLNYRRFFLGFAPLALVACISLSACAEDDADSPNHRAGAGGAAGSSGGAAGATKGGNSGSVSTGEAGSGEAGAEPIGAAGESSEAGATG